MTFTTDPSQNPPGLPPMRGEPREVCPNIWMLPGFGNATLVLTDDAVVGELLGAVPEAGEHPYVGAHLPRLATHGRQARRILAGSLGPCHAVPPISSRGW